MGRGRSRGRGISNVTAVPVASQGIVSTPCFKTYYDGVDDYYTSTEAALKFSGAMTVALEINPSSMTDNDTFFWNRPSATGGFIFKLYNNGRIYGLISGSGANTIPESAAGVLSTGSWQKCLLTCGVNDTGRIFVEDSLVATGATLVSGMGATASTFYQGTAGDATSRVFDGFMRNITICSGATSTPESWDPTDPSSLVGCTVVYYASKGNTENEEGLSFTEFGAPVTSEC